MNPSAGTLTVEPALMEVVLEKSNETKNVTLLYKNTSSQPLTLEIFPIDFKQQNDLGDIQFLGNDTTQYSYSLSSFLEFSTNLLELPPQGTGKLLVTVRNREDISPGGHYTAVVARPLVQSSEGKTTVAPSLSTTLFLHKTGGERFNLSLKSVSWPSYFVVFQYKNQVELLFQNEGNVHVVPYGVIEVQDTFGRQLYKGSINTGSIRVLPETRRYINNDLIVVEKSFPVSLNTIKVQGNDSLHKTQYLYKNYFIYLNPWVGLGIIAVIVLVIFLRMRSKHSSRS